ncbi:MAG: DUF5103 domain-containing protein [Bacteroidales bacterium]|nr:DUF5103 domain-containing protein [Bacteroidales bacterium]
MKHLVKTALLALAVCTMGRAQTVSDSVWTPAVKSVAFCRAGSPQEPPVLTLGSRQRLELAFDLLADTPPTLRYSIRHCNAAWQPDSLEAYDFMTGFPQGDITQYDFSFTTLRPYIHFRHTLPEAYAEFTHSGNYLLTVHLDGEPDSVLLTRRFWVSEQAVALGATVGRPHDGADIERRQAVDALVDPGTLALNPRYLALVAQQNGRTDNQRTLEFSGFDRQRLAFRNRSCNIFDGGNTFRFFDAANLRTPLYNIARIEQLGGEVYAILRPEEDRSRRQYIYEAALNGGMKINAWDRRNPTLEADYVWVNFSLPMAQPFLDGSVHIVGGLTDWKLDSASRMDYNPSLRAYTKRLLLKQGYYSYQLLFKPAGATQGQTARLEGDHREAPNRYTLYLYQREPGDRADRLLAVSQVVAP